MACKITKKSGEISTFQQDSNLHTQDACTRGQLDWCALPYILKKNPNRKPQISHQILTEEPFTSEHGAQKNISS
jgi:hypothetical protein